MCRWLPRLEAEASQKLKEWNALKKRKYGESPKPLPKNVPAMPADSTIVSA